MAGVATHGRTAEQVPDDVGRQDGGVGEEEEMSYDLDERVGRLWESGIGLGGAPGLWQECGGMAGITPREVDFLEQEVLLPCIQNQVTVECQSVRCLRFSVNN
jgi:hypothetical protein